jgi:hypothetical protein
MARRPRSAKLETRANRLKLPIKKNPQAPLSIGPGLTLEYRRCKGPGRWCVKVADGRGGNWEKTLPGVADDHEEADGEHFLLFGRRAKRRGRWLAAAAAVGRKRLVRPSTATRKTSVPAKATSPTRSVRAIICPQRS